MADRKILIFLLLLLSPFLRAQDPLLPDSVNGKRSFVEDDPVSSMLDSLERLKIFENSRYLKTNANEIPGILEYFKAFQAVEHG